MIDILKKNYKKIAEVEYFLLHHKEETHDDTKSFFRWLKMHNIYSFYIKEVIKYYDRKSMPSLGYSDVYDFVRKLISNSRYNIIDTSLFWSGTEQGHDFWSFFNWLYANHCSTYSLNYTLEELAQNIKKECGITEYN